MADSWGGMILNITEYSRPAADIFMSEKRLLSDPASSDPQTILMGAGRMRKRRTVAGWAEQADFDVLEADNYSYAVKTVTFEDGFSMAAYIEKLDAELKKGAAVVWYNATFIEA